MIQTQTAFLHSLISSNWISSLQNIFVSFLFADKSANTFNHIVFVLIGAKLSWAKLRLCRPASGAHAAPLHSFYIEKLTVFSFSPKSTKQRRHGVIMDLLNSCFKSENYSLSFCLCYYFTSLVLVLSCRGCFERKHFGSPLCQLFCVSVSQQ